MLFYSVLHQISVRISPALKALMTKIRVTDSTLLHGSMQTLQEDPDTELFIGRSKNQVEEFYPRDHKENEYILTPFQVSIYNKVNPPKDPERPSLPYKGPPLFISQAFKFDHQFRLPDLQAAANKVLSMYPILRTQFYRNEKIVDGDVQGLINKSDWRSLPADAVVEVVAPSRHSSLSDGIDGVSLTEFTTGWMRENPGFGRLYRILYVSDLNAEHLQKDSSEHVVFVGSTLIMDRRSLEWLVRETLKLYSHCNDLRLAGRFNSSIMEFLEAYECKERTSFATFSETCIESKFSMSFWRTQCIEVVQESIDHLEKDDLDGQIKKLELEKHNAKGSILSLSTRKTNIETDLNKLIEQRRRLDSGQNGEGEMYMFTDKRTNESIIISVEAKNELIKAAIGLDSATDTIVPFLDKHAVPKDVQRKIGASVLSVEGFAEMTDDSIQGLGILTRDRRKVLALRDHVATRIRDSFYEQQKIKSNLERRILKNKRDLDKINGMMSDAKEKLEVNDDMAMRLASILKPPIYEAHIPALTMRVLHTKLHQNPKTSNETYYGFIPFTIPQEILIQLRNFREGFMLSKKSATKGSDSSSTGMMSSDDSNEEDFDYKQGERQIKSVDAVCLAAFCVLLKHISGHEKFLLGFSQSYRSHDLLVGPLSDTVPLKVDMCKKRMPFESLFSSMHRAVFHARQQGAACPSSKIGNAFKSSKSLPVRFEVVSYKSTQAWLRKGMHVDDLLGKSDVQSGNQTRSIQGKRLWDVDETDDFNLKLVLVEGRNSISGGIRYQTDKFTEAQVSKWVSKYLSVLQSIEYAQRKISVSTIISRYDCLRSFLDNL